MTSSQTPRPSGSLPVASTVETVRTLATVLAPVVARGAIIRRPRAVRLAQRVDADSRAVRQLQRLRRRYGPGPVVLKVPVRRLTVLLEPQDVVRVLDESPDPFTPATREKRAALGHFQPHGVLVSTGRERTRRRALNEAVLDTGRPLHRCVDHVVAAVHAEADDLLQGVGPGQELTWDRFARSWWRVVRTVVLGASARDDEDVTDLLQRLRRDANWAYLRPRRPGAGQELDRRLAEYLDRADAGSLAAELAATPSGPGLEPQQQVPQWLFAYDAAGWALFRAMALLAVHPDAAARARAELPSSPDLPFLRATVLESLRLWPTTPAILRDTTHDTTWESGVLPAGSAVLVYAPFFHRDETRLEAAHRFHPDQWLRERTAADWPLVPFSAGPGMCPGRNLVLLTTSTFIGRLLDRRHHELVAPRLDPSWLPGSLSPFHLRFRTAGTTGR